MNRTELEAFLYTYYDAARADAGAARDAAYDAAWDAQVRRLVRMLETHATADASDTRTSAHD